MADVSKLGANGIEYDVCDTAARLGIQTANSNISSLRDDLTNDESDIADLQSDMSTAQTDITTLQGNIADLQASDADLQNQINAAKNTSAAGYCKMPDGTLIKWGIATAKRSGDTLDFSANQVFLSAPTVIVSQAYNATTTIRCNFGVASVSTGNCIVYAYDTYTNALSEQTNLAYHWLAIGRWK